MRFRSDVLDRNIASISSMNTMHGCIFLAAVNIALVSAGVSPRYFLSSIDETSWNEFIFMVIIVIMSERHLSRFNEWQLSRFNELLSLDRKDENNFSVRFFKELYLRYRVKESKSGFVFEPDTSRVYIDGRKRNQRNDEKFYIEKNISKVNTEGETIYRDRLLLSVAGGKSNLSKKQIDELLNQWFYLCNETSLLRSVRQYCFGNEYSPSIKMTASTTTFSEKFTNWGDNDLFGGLVKVLAIGDIDKLQVICDHYNSSTTGESYRICSDKAHALLVMPYDVFKGKTKAIEEFLYGHSVTKLLNPDRGRPMVVSKEQLLWTSFSCRRDDTRNWASGEALSKTFSPNNARTSFAAKGMALEEMPYWAQEHHPNDKTHGVLITVVVYKDQMIFSIPAGKRELGETAWECAVRETVEEAGLDINCQQWLQEYHLRLNPAGEMQTFIVSLITTHDNEAESLTLGIKSISI